ncbi:MAG: sugar phosphate isomerase/epimerase [Acidobacteriota bacterium]
MRYTRRQLGQIALGSVPAAALLTHAARAAGQTTRPRPNSKVAGVQIGLNVPYSFGNNNMPGDEVLDKCLELGVSAVEIRSQPIERAMGWIAPAAVPGQPASQAAGPLQAWRRTADLAKAQAFRKQWADAGVALEILKFDNIYAFDDQELDYAFALATAIGARAISCEIDAKGTARIGQFADKHQLMVGYHGHAETTPAHWEAAFAQAKFNGANLDLGHFVAGNNTSPVPFLTQHHDRITHIHVKDRKMHEGPNVPFGQGDTPIAEVLRLLRDKKWNIQATIEFEYPVPEGSNRMAEIAKAVAFCRQAL